MKHTHVYVVLLCANHQVLGRPERKGGACMRLCTTPVHWFTSRLLGKVKPIQSSTVNI